MRHMFSLSFNGLNKTEITNYRGTTLHNGWLVQCHVRHHVWDAQARITQRNDKPLTWWLVKAPQSKIVIWRCMFLNQSYVLWFITALFWATTAKMPIPQTRLFDLVRTGELGFDGKFARLTKSGLVSRELSDSWGKILLDMVRSNRRRGKQW